MGKAQFSNQGDYLWHLIKTAKWDQKVTGQQYSRWDAYLLKTFQVTHLNVLKEDEIRRAIATLKPYAAKAKFDQCKGIRQQIMAMASAKGKNAAWVHEMMIPWGFGESMRDLNYEQLMSLRGTVMEALGIQWAKQPGWKKPGRKVNAKGAGETQ